MADAYDVSVAFQDANNAFPNLPVAGLDARVARGTNPGTFRIRVPNDANLTGAEGDLTIQSGDAEAVKFARCVPDLSTLRNEFLPGGMREFSVLLRDRRVTWPGTVVNGSYNRRYRDNSIAPASRRTDSELVDEVLDALGEPTGVSLPGTYPEADWDSKPASEALDAIAGVLPAYACRRKDDSYTVALSPDGDDIDGNLLATTPYWAANLDSGPKTIRIRCNKTWYGAQLETEAVGLDTDGQYKLLNDLSYKPATGWEKEWPTLLAGVPAGNRAAFALPTVFRCYRIKVPQTIHLDSETITLNDLNDIWLDDRRLVFGYFEPPPAAMLGLFWPMGDHPYNTGQCPVVGNPFTIDRDLRIITFEYPIIAFSNCITAARLKLATSFHLRDADGNWKREEFEIERESGSGTKIIDIPYLWRAKAMFYVNCDAQYETDNMSTLQAEAQVYLDAWKAHYDAIVSKLDVSFAGLHPTEMSGKVAYLEYRLGKGVAPKTRVARHYVPTR
jgi:hypothetical protein